MCRSHASWSFSGKWPSNEAPAVLALQQLVYVKFLGSANTCPYKKCCASPAGYIAGTRLKHISSPHPESLLANKRGATRSAAKKTHIEQKDDAARRRKSEQPADRADGPLGRPRAAISDAAAENDAEEEARDARRGER